MTACGKTAHRNPVCSHIPRFRLFPYMGHGGSQLKQRFKILCLLHNAVSQNEGVISSGKIGFRHGFRFSVRQAAIPTARADNDRRSFSVGQSGTDAVHMQPSSYAAIRYAFGNKIKHPHNRQSLPLSYIWKKSARGSGSQEPYTSTG